MHRSGIPHFDVVCAIGTRNKMRLKHQRQVLRREYYSTTRMPNNFLTAKHLLRAETEWEQEAASLQWAEAALQNGLQHGQLTKCKLSQLAHSYPNCGTNVGGQLSRHEGANTRQTLPGMQ